MTSYKKAVHAHGEYVLDYVESFRGLRNNDGTLRPCFFVGKGRVAGNTAPIPSGLHTTPRKAWQSAAIVLKLSAS